MIYLDYAASAVPFPEAAEEMQRSMLEQFANPGALHGASAGPRKTLQDARKTVAAAMGVRPEEVFFTSGGTEANNWAVKLGCREGRRHVVVSAVEHKSVLEPVRDLERRGYEVTVVHPDRSGVISPAAVEAAIRRDTGLLCIQAVNNETGVMQDVAAMGAIARKYGARFLCDAVQSFGHCDQPLYKADFISISAHKLGGPRGVGCLVVRYPHILLPLIHGGGQEQGGRSGTENVPGIAGFAEAVRLSQKIRQEEDTRLRELSERLIRKLKEGIPSLEINGEGALRHPGIVSCRFPGIRGEEMAVRLDSKGICVSPGAACSARDSKPSHVLLAMGLGRETAEESVRFSLGRYTTAQELDTAADAAVQIWHRKRL